MFADRNTIFDTETLLYSPFTSNQKLNLRSLLVQPTYRAPLLPINNIEHGFEIADDEGVVEGGVVIEPGLGHF